MPLAEIINANGSQLVKVPQEFHLQGNTVSIRRQGKALILEPAKPTTCPAEFFDRVFIEDPSFTRPHQGAVPPAPKLD
jgi:virulence-associated protein VagC